MKQVTSTGQPPGPTMPGRPSRNKALFPLLLGIVVVASAINLLRNHENRYERLASDITRAVAANDMRPVEKEFNAIRRPQLEDRGKVGQLSDFVNAEGKLKNIKEQAQSDAKADTHHFIATFERGQRAEDLTVDADGKIVDFHVTPLDAK